MTAVHQQQTLAGCVLAITADRRSGELAAALERRGAVIRHAPALSIVPHADDEQLIAMTKQIVAEPPDLVVVTTGVGLRGWIEAADAAGLADDLLQVLGRARLVARGPKARGALQAAGLQADWVAESETSAEIIEVLTGEGVRGMSIVVQHHGAGDDGLHTALASEGAHVRDVVVYRWGPPPDPARVSASARWAAAGEIDGVLFTSAPGAAAWLASVLEQDLLPSVEARAGTGALLLACVGPVTAAPLAEAGLRTMEPERSRMGALVRAVIGYFDTSGIPTAAGPLALRSGGCLIDGRYVPLTPGPLAVLRALAEDPGAVLSRGRLLDVLPGESTDPHAVEAVVGRLRDALGSAAVVQTVVKRGYRLAVPTSP